MRKVKKQNSEGQTLDDLSIAIVKLLQTDGRMTTRELSKKLSKTEVTVRKHLKYLQESNIVNIRALIDPSNAGYSHEVVLHLRVDTRHLETAALMLSELPEVRFLVITSGTYSILCLVVLQSAGDLLKFLVNKVSAVEGLSSVETTFFLKTIKRADQWLPFHGS